MRLTAGWGRTVGLTIHPRLILAATVLGLCVHPSVSAAQTPSESDSSTVVQSYDDALETIHEARQALLLRYQNADSDSARMLVLGEAKRQLVSFVRDDLAPFWYGTPWAFNGTTEVPRSGAIACGYFVTTMLRDVGVTLNRVRLAQQASEKIIKTLVGPKSIRRFSNASLETFLDAVREWGDGLYIVGLDIHVGFIVNEGGNVRFIHSSYVGPLCVVDENAAGSQILASSSYRVFGKLTGDDRFMLAWLRGKPIRSADR